jgi:hypothetical protein
LTLTCGPAPERTARARSSSSGDSGAGPREPSPFGRVVDQPGPPRGPGRAAGGAGVGLGERAEQVEQLAAAPDCSDQLLDGARVVGVTPGGQVDEGQVLAHEDLDLFAVGGRQAHPLHLGPGQGRAGDRVVGDPGELADVVEQGRQQQQVGPVNVAQEPLRLDDRLDLVPVDRVPVDRVALRPRAHPGPLGQPAHDQSGLVARLPDPDLRGAGREQLQQRLAGGGRPRRGQRRAVGGQVVDGDG